MAEFSRLSYSLGTRPNQKSNGLIPLGARLPALTNPRARSTFKCKWLIIPAVGKHALIFILGHYAATCRDPYQCANTSIVNFLTLFVLGGAM